MKRYQAIVLLSGGLDSTVNAVLAQERHREVMALTFDYGQRAAAKEIEASGRLCRQWDIDHQVIALPWLAAITEKALVHHDQRLPEYADRPEALDDLVKATESAEAVWVPNRNGVFLNIAGAYAEATDADWVIAGFNAEEAATFSDNTVEFTDCMNACFEFSTLTHPQCMSYTAEMDKEAIVRVALEKDIALNDCWPCYEGGTTRCGTCESCARFDRALMQARQ